MLSMWVIHYVNLKHFFKSFLHRALCVCWWLCLWFLWPHHPAPSITVLCCVVLCVGSDCAAPPQCPPVSPALLLPHGCCEGPQLLEDAMNMPHHLGIALIATHLYLTLPSSFKPCVTVCLHVCLVRGQMNEMNEQRGQVAVGPCCICVPHLKPVGTFLFLIS